MWLVAHHLIPGHGRGRGRPPSRRGTIGSSQLATPSYVDAAIDEAAQPGVGTAPTFTLPITAVPTLASQYVCPFTGFNIGNFIAGIT